jgi:CubicO group peptidase (beta-lactamase class C family)
MTLTSDRIEQLLNDGVRQKTYPGAVWVVGDTDGSHYSGACGHLDPTHPDEPMRLDTIFDIASLTKILAVWSVIGTLWEDDSLALDDKLATLIPDLAAYPLGEVTVHQLLTHTAGLPLRANLKNLYGY